LDYLQKVFAIMNSSLPGTPPGSDLPWADLPGLLAASESDAVARDAVLTRLYPELKRIAESHMRRERPDHTLQATALVSEFFLDVARNPAFTARTRGQFLKLASVAMRRLLVDYARSHGAEKRGGHLLRIDIDGLEVGCTSPLAEVVAIDELLEQLAVQDLRMAQIVELRFFGGLTNREIADALGINERTVKRDWHVARAWLYERVCDQRHGQPGLGSR
jgi:RNA polymerase sigma factor (TIGR02999 family)